MCASDCLIRVTDTLQITISEQLTNKLTPQPNHQKSLQMIALVSYFDKIQTFWSSASVCSISRNDRHVQVVFLGSRNPGKVEGDQQCGWTGSSETMASLPVVCLQYNCTKCISPKSYNTFVQMVPVEQWSPSLTTRCLLAVSPYNCKMYFSNKLKCICPNFKVYLSKMLNVFVQMVAVKQWPPSLTTRCLPAGSVT